MVEYLVSVLCTSPEMLLAEGCWAVRRWYSSIPESQTGDSRRSELEALCHGNSTWASATER